MLVVVMAAQKGGCGKTTLCGHLAVEAENTGSGPVAIIDTDPQGSLSQWWNARSAETPQFAKVGAHDLESALGHLKRSGIRLVIIDTPPAISESISQVIAHADLVVVPTRPSPHDLRAVGATVDIAERRKKPLLFVINEATQRARITGESAVALSQHGMVAPITVHHRVDFAASMVDGRTVGEVLPNSPSAKEVSDLWLYLRDRLARLSKDTSVASETEMPKFSLTPLSAEPEMLDDSSDEDADESLIETPVVPKIPLISTPSNAARAVPLPQSGLKANGYRIEVRQEPASDIERRSGGDRREQARPFFGGAERRSGPFGRRNNDN
ncbi:MAG TPA: ParA family protein [Micropepsaceae bacterium]|nr:ParA family protein [Micropepsaceae bacterium]